MIEINDLVSGKKYLIKFDDLYIRKGQIVATFLKYEDEDGFTWAVFDCIEITGTRWEVEEIISLVC